MKNFFGIDNLRSVGLKAELGRAWACALGVAATNVVVHGFMGARHLFGVNPLTVQGFMGRQCHKALQNVQTVGPRRGLEAAHQNIDAWGLLVNPQMEAMSPVSPNLPVVFLLTAFVSWPVRTNAPLCCDSTGLALRDSKRFWKQCSPTRIRA